MKDFLKTWWCFFWKFLLIFAVLLFLSRILLQYLFDIGVIASGALNTILMARGILVNLASSLAVFAIMFHRRHLHSPGFAAKSSPLMRTWWAFSWRFTIYSFVFGMISGALLILAAYGLGKHGTPLLAGLKYAGNLAILPASLFVWWLLTRRRHNGRPPLLSPAADEAIKSHSN